MYLKLKNTQQRHYNLSESLESAIASLNFIQPKIGDDCLRFAKINKYVSETSRRPKMEFHPQL